MSRNESPNRGLDCVNFEERIHQVLDDRLALTGDKLLIDHAAHCTRCEEILLDYDSIEDSLNCLSPGFAQTLNRSTKVYGFNRSQRPLMSRPVMVFATIAAALVIYANIFHGLNSPTVNQTALTVPGEQLSLPHLNLTAPQMDSLAEITPTHRISRTSAPDISPFSPNFSVVNSICAVSFPRAPSWDDITNSVGSHACLDTLMPVVSFSATIPAIRPVHCSLNGTIEYLKESFFKSQRDIQPDLGLSNAPTVLAAA